MANQVTLGDLKARALDRADMTNSSFIETARLRDYLNAGGSELYNILVRVYGDDYFFKKDTIVTVANQEEYNLPPDFYKLTALWLVLGSGNNTQRRELKRFMYSDVGTDHDHSLSLSTQLPRYRLTQNNLFLFPKPDGGKTIEFWYVPQYQKMIADTDSVNLGIPTLPNGWEEYLVVWAAIKCLEKEESDTRDLKQDLADLRSQFINTAPDRDTKEGERVVDVSRRFDGRPGHLLNLLR